MSPHRFIRCLLIPAFLLANLLCLCGHAMAATPDAVQRDCCGRPVPAAKPESCCENKSHHSNDESGDHQTCPSCQAKERMVAENTPPFSHHLAMQPLAFVSLIDALLPHASADAGFSALPTQVAPAPPPDRLSLLCILQV